MVNVSPGLRVSSDIVEEMVIHRKICVKRPLLKIQKIGFQDQ